MRASPVPPVLVRRGVLHRLAHEAHDPVHVALAQVHAAAEAADAVVHVAALGADIEDREARGEVRVHLARAHHAEGEVAERDQRAVRGAHHRRRLLLGDVPVQDHVAEPARRGALADLFPPLAAADEEERHRLALEGLRRVEHRVELVPVPRVAEIDHGEAVLQTVFGRRRPRAGIAPGREHRRLFPVRDHRHGELVGLHGVLAQEQVAHRGVEGDEVVEPGKKPAVEPAHRAAHQPALFHHAETLGGVGVAVHVPEDDLRAGVEEPVEHGGPGDVGRGGERDDHVLPGHRDELPRAAEVEAEVVEAALQDRALAEARGPETADARVGARLGLRLGAGGDVAAEGGDDGHLVAAVGAVLGERGGEVRRRADIRGVELVDDRHAHRRSLRSIRPAAGRRCTGSSRRRSGPGCR